MLSRRLGGFFKKSPLLSPAERKPCILHFVQNGIPGEPLGLHLK